MTDSNPVSPTTACHEFRVGDRVIFRPRDDRGEVEVAGDRVAIRFESGCFGIYDAAWFARHQLWIVKEQPDGSTHTD